MDGPAITDALLAAAWLVLVGDLLRSAGRAGHVRPARRLIAIGLLATIVGAGYLLEEATGGRLAWHPAAGAFGMSLATAGLALHVWARRTLAQGWSPVVSPPAGSALAENGPYAYLRHPLYAAILLLAAGTVAGHCSRATLAAGVGFAIGIALKRRAEDRALEERFGDRWRAYAARVPAFVPRFSRARP